MPKICELRRPTRPFHKFQIPSSSFSILSLLLQSFWRYVSPASPTVADSVLPTILLASGLRNSLGCMPPHLPPAACAPLPRAFPPIPHTGQYRQPLYLPPVLTRQIL